jgi:hypothetical protein
MSPDDSTADGPPDPVARAQARITQLSDSLRVLHRHVTRVVDPQVLTLHRQIWEWKRHLAHADLDLPREAREAFNGQFSKHRIFAELEAGFDFGLYVETGSFRGETTAFLGARGRPVLSVEIDPGFCAEARQRVAGLAGVEVVEGSSEVVLAARLGTDVAAQTGFFYLDAHWRDEIPLVPEIELVFARMPAAVAMVDDFRVPGDDGYGFDSYPAGELSLTLVGETVASLGLAAWVPSMASAIDHCWPHILPPRGTLVLARDPAAILRLDAMASLRRIDC